MNILHVIPGLTYERGGPTAVVCALARHQVAAGHRVSVLTTDQGARHGEQPADPGDEVEVERLPVRGPDRVAYAPGFAQALRARLRTSDVVHIHSIFTYPVHAALREARRRRVPVVLRPCGLLHRYGLRRSRWIKQIYLGAWGRMVRRTCSAWHFTSINESQESWPWDQSPQFILPNGIEPAEFALDRQQARADVERSWLALGGAPYVLFLGRLHPKKRLDILLPTFLAGAPPDFKLVVAGPDEARLWDGLATRWLRDPRTRQRVLRLDTVTGCAKAQLLAAAQLFVLPSEHENFGVAVLEALASGTPVLLSPQVDLAEAAATAGVAVTAPLDIDSWRERIASCLTGAIPGDPIAERARRWAADNYAWGSLVARLGRHYHEILSGRLPRTTATRSFQPVAEGVP